jgi:hypothetical protein
MTDLPRVGTAPCGCGYFDTGGGLAKIHDDKCEFAPKKAPKAEKPEEPKPEPKAKK